jgi:anti-sigma regulatory factor (Ser/Thr protein kinase)
MSKLVGIGELSASIGLHVNTLRKMADSAKIPCQRTPGGQRRFNVSEVQKALRNRTPLESTLETLAKVDPSDKKWRKKYKIAGLDEVDVWKECVKELDLNLEEPCADLVPYAFTEMLNNSIDHSLGEEVEIEFTESNKSWTFRILDDGVGVFAKVTKSFGLANNLEAIAELSKGKRTSAPEAHTGEGIFFTSKAVDHFQIQANQISWTIDNLIDDFSIGISSINQGTAVTCSISRNTEKKLFQLFKQFTKDHEFYASQPTIKLFESGLTFLSRSEARRLTIGLEEFSEIRLDFQKVASVGQGFADELFRVWATAHPTIKLIPIRMNEAVAFMINRSLNNK